MKKLYLIIIIFSVFFSTIACSVSTKMTREEVVNIIENLEINSIDQEFNDDLLSYTFRGDAYYLMGELNEYILITMYYKQKYVNIRFVFNSLNVDDLSLSSLNIEYFDLLDENFIFLSVGTGKNLYQIEGKNYDEFFEELSLLTISDIEWILDSADLP